jgi:hypothetical protein
MSTYYSQNNGNWSTLSNWDTVTTGGGSDPASEAAMNDQIFVIQAGHAILMDVDMSTFANGIAGLTITGHASSTPGMLYWKDGTNGTLKIKTATAIVGTNVTNKGRLLANQDGVWRHPGIIVTADADTDTFTSTSHGLADGTVLAIRVPIDQTTPSLDISMPAPLLENVNYYVRDATTHTFKVALTDGGTAIDLTTNGQGTIYVDKRMSYAYKAIILCDGTAQITGTYLDIALVGTEPTTKYVRTYGTKQTVVGSASADTLTCASHGWANTTALQFKVSAGGSLPAPLLPDIIYYVVDTATDTFKVAPISGGTAINLTTDGSGTIEAYSGHTNTSTGQMNVLDDVNSETHWDTTSGHNDIMLINIRPDTAQYQRVTLSGKGSGTVTLSANVANAMMPGAVVVFGSRNVSLRSNSTGSSQPIIYGGYGANLACELKNTAGTGTTFYGRLLSNTYYSTMSGIIHQGSYQIEGCFYTVMSGLCCLGSMCIYTITKGIVTGMVLGGYSMNLHRSKVSGKFYGGGAYGITNSFFANITNECVIKGATIGLASMYNCKINASIYCCSRAMDGGQNNVFYGKISDTNINTNRLENNPKNFIRNADLDTVGSNPSFRNNQQYSGRWCFENYMRTGTQKIVDAYGDIVMTACDGTGDAPSVDPDGGSGYCVEASNIQSVCNPIDPLLMIDDQRIWLTAASHTVTYKLQTTYSSISAGNLKLTCTYIGTDGALAETTHAPEITTRSSATDWSQKLTVSFTQTVEGWATFKIELIQYEANDEVYVWPKPVVSTLI